MSSSSHIVTVSFFGKIGDLAAKLGVLGDKAAQTENKMGSSFEKGGKRVGGAMSKLGNTLGNFGIPFGESIAGIGDHFKEVEGKGKSFSGIMSEVGKASLIGIGAGAIAGGAEVLKMGENFQTTTDSIATHAGIPVKAAQQISSAFLNTQSQVLESGQQLANAYAPVAGVFTSLYGHALDSKDALEVMTAASDLSSASGTDLGTTTQTLAGIMAAYNIPVSGAAAATDQLLNISKATGSPLTDLGTSLGRLHARLGTAAPSIADTGALMEALGHHGLTGSRGTLVVATAFQTLEGGSKATKKTLDQLGVSIYDSNGKFVGMQSVIAQLQPKLAGMSDAQKALTLKTLFGASAAQVMNGVISDGPDKFNALKTSVEKSGTAHDAAALNAKSLKGEEEGLKKNVENLGTKMGTLLVPAVQKVIGITMQAVVWAEKHKGIMEIVAGVVGTIVVAAIAAYVVSMAAAAIATIAATWPILAVIAGLALLGAAIIYLSDHWKNIWNDIKKAASDAWHWIDNTLVQPIGNFFGKTLPGFLDKGVQYFKDLPGRIIKGLGNVGMMLYDAGSQIIGGFLKGIKDAFEKVKKFVGGIASTIAHLKGPLSYDAILLVPHGNAIMGGLARGLQQGFKAQVAPTLGNITRSVGASSIPIPGANSRAAALPGGINVSPVYNVTITGTSEQIATQTRKMIVESHEEMITLLETRLAHA